MKLTTCSDGRSCGCKQVCLSLTPPPPLEFLPAHGLAALSGITAHHQDRQIRAVVKASDLSLAEQRGRLQAKDGLG